MIWVLTSTFGDGHNTAARSVAEALRLQSPGEELLVTDIISTVHPVLGALAQWAYQQAIVHTPALWLRAYDWMAHTRALRPESAGLQPQLLYVRDFLVRHRPRAIVSAYPSYSSLLHALRQDGVAVPPVITLITDSISVHPMWLAAPSDLYLVADAETRDVITAAGVDAAAVRVTGFPVSGKFSPSPRPSVQERLLYLPSTPTAHVLHTLQALVPLLQRGVGLTLLAGKHLPRLHHPLRKFMDAHPHLDICVLGWTDQVPELLLSHRAVITKAGGAILHEALAARVPMIIDYVVPGQEEGNADYVTRHHCGLRTHTPQQTAQAVERLFGADPAFLHTVQQSLAERSILDAAAHAAQEILLLADQSLPRPP
jgi:processive 1,2-diacylglycerol beta-glucosyltransferase